MTDVPETRPDTGPGAGPAGVHDVLLHRYGTLVVALVGPRAVLPPLDPAERALCRTRSAARRADFAAGRRAAARCLGELGRPGPVLAAADGSPVFPPGTQGSISHCGGWGVCAASTRARALGVDLERRGRVPAAGLRHVCGPRELDWIRRARDPAEADRRATEIFSAKEAVYKARNALPVPRVDFPGIRLRPVAAGFVTEPEEGGEPEEQVIGTAFFRVWTNWLGAYALTVAVTAARSDRREQPRRTARRGGPERRRTDG